MWSSYGSNEQLVSYKYKYAYVTCYTCIEDIKKYFLMNINNRLMYKNLPGINEQDLFIQM